MVAIGSGGRVHAIDLGTGAVVRDHLLASGASWTVRGEPLYVEANGRLSALHQGIRIVDCEIS